MTTPFPFVAGQVLTAAQLNDIQNLPISDKTASYTLLVGDVTKRTIMNAQALRLLQSMTRSLLLATLFRLLIKVQALARSPQAQA
jgi:hypothetical protein